MPRIDWREHARRPITGVLRRMRRIVRALRVRLERRPPCVVGIPMMNLHDWTARVVADLGFDEFDELIIYDHGSDDPESIAWLREIERHPKITVDRRAMIPEESLYRSWNDTIRRALEYHPVPKVDVVILNNDVRLPRGFVRFLTRALRSGDPRMMISYPDRFAPRTRGLPARIELTPTRGLYNNDGGGLTGWAFAVKAESFRHDLPFIDERLKFYSGDRDLIHAVETRGYHAARVNGLPCEHRLGTTRKRRRDLVAQQKRDVSLWWGEHRRGLKG